MNLQEDFLNEGQLTKIHIIMRSLQILI